jgi:hypothetical protein
LGRSTQTLQPVCNRFGSLDPNLAAGFGSNDPNIAAGLGRSIQTLQPAWVD